MCVDRARSQSYCLFLQHRVRQTSRDPGKNGLFHPERNQNSPPTLRLDLLFLINMTGTILFLWSTIFRLKDWISHRSAKRCPMVTYSRQVRNSRWQNRGNSVKWLALSLLGATLPDVVSSSSSLWLFTTGNRAHVSLWSWTRIFALINDNSSRVVTSNLFDKKQQQWLFVSWQDGNLLGWCCISWSQDNEEWTICWISNNCWPMRKIGRKKDAMVTDDEVFLSFVLADAFLDRSTQK